MIEDSTAAAPFYLPRKWEGFVAGVCAFVVYLAFEYFGDEARGTVAGAFFGALALSIRFCWPIRNKTWYLAELAVLVAIHAILIIMFNWSFAAYWSGLIVMPFMAADFCIIMAAIFFGYVLINGQPDNLFTELM